MSVPAFPGPPRDLIGYGPTPPHPQWPNNAKIAVSFVINYEEGGEYSLTNPGDTHSETYLSEIPSQTRRDRARNTNVESEYEYGSRAGIWRLLKVFEATGFKGTVYAVGRALELNPLVAPKFRDAGWELSSHGWRWIDYATYSREDERRDIEKCVDLFTAQAGRAPPGWYVGRLSPYSHDLIREIYHERGLALSWLSDAYNDDLPYYQPNTQDGRDATLIIPYSLDCNDFKFFMPNNWSSPDDFYQYLVSAFDQLYEEGEQGTPKMMSIGLHPRISGRPGRVGAMKQFVEYVKGKEGVWVATREEIARHWRDVHPCKQEAKQT